MSVLCRAFGHDVSHRGRQLDPFTFAELGHCKRCGAALEHDPQGAWREVVDSRREEAVLSH